MATYSKRSDDIDSALRKKAVPAGTASRLPVPSFSRSALLAGWMATCLGDEEPVRHWSAMHRTRGHQRSHCYTASSRPPRALAGWPPVQRHQNSRVSLHRALWDRMSQPIRHCRHSPRSPSPWRLHGCCRQRAPARCPTRARDWSHSTQNDERTRCIRAGLSRIISAPHLDDGVGEIHALQHDGLALVAQRVAGRHILQSRDGNDVARPRVRDVLRSNNTFQRCY